MKNFDSDEEWHGSYEPYLVICARCGKTLSCENAEIEEGNEWECKLCWFRRECITKGFCLACGARVPGIIGEGRCKYCMEWEYKNDRPSNP